MSRASHSDIEQSMQSPNLRFRDSQTLWGPLCFLIRSHREGAERGYEAGTDAYEQTKHKYGFNGQPLGFLTVQSFQDLMDYYLAMPRYRPRQVTGQIIGEWRSLFLLAWIHQVMQEHPQLLREGEEKNFTAGSARSPM